MTWALRSVALAAGAAALLSTQAAYAAPVRTAPAVDPLVTLSLLGTTQSRAALCGPGATCILPTAMGATAAVPSPAVTTGAATAAAMQGPPPGKRIDPILLGLGLLFFIGLAIALASGGGDGEGNLTPISPA